MTIDHLSQLNRTAYYSGMEYIPGTNNDKFNSLNYGPRVAKSYSDRQKFDIQKTEERVSENITTIVQKTLSGNPDFFVLASKPYEFHKGNLIDIYA